MLSLGADLSNSDGERGIAVKALVDSTGINGNQVPGAESVFVGDPVNDDVVGREAEIPRVPQITQERWCAPVLGDHPRPKLVQLEKGHPRFRGLSHRQEDRGYCCTRFGHLGELAAALDGDHEFVVTESWRSAESRAAMTRSVITSMPPVPSTDTIRPLPS